MKKLLILGALAMLMGPAANATTIGVYNVSAAGTVATTSFGPGTTSGVGTATLDDSGILYISMSNLNLQLPFAAVNTNVSANTLVFGTLSGPPLTPTMTGNSGTDTFTSCLDLGVPVCSYVALGVPGPLGSVTDPIAFNNNIGGITVLTTVEPLAGGLATGTTTYTLTATPEPGTVILLAAGLAALAGRRQRA